MRDRVGWSVCAHAHKGQGEGQSVCVVRDRVREREWGGVCVLTFIRDKVRGVVHVYGAARYMYMPTQIPFAHIHLLTNPADLQMHTSTPTLAHLPYTLTTH